MSSSAARHLASNGAGGVQDASVIPPSAAEIAAAVSDAFTRHIPVSTLGAVENALLSLGLVASHAEMLRALAAVQAQRVAAVERSLREGQQQTTQPVTDVAGAAAGGVVPVLSMASGKASPVISPRENKTLALSGRGASPVAAKGATSSARGGVVDTAAGGSPVSARAHRRQSTLTSPLTSRVLGVAGAAAELAATKRREQLLVQRACFLPPILARKADAKPNRDADAGSPGNFEGDGTSGKKHHLPGPGSASRKGLATNEVFSRPLTAVEFDAVLTHIIFARQRAADESGDDDDEDDDDSASKHLYAESDDDDSPAAAERRQQRQQQTSHLRRRNRKNNVLAGVYTTLQRNLFELFENRDRRQNTMVAADAAGSGGSGVGAAVVPTRSGRTNRLLSEGAADGAATFGGAAFLDLDGITSPQKKTTTNVHAAMTQQMLSRRSVSIPGAPNKQLPVPAVGEDDVDDVDNAPFTKVDEEHPASSHSQGRYDGHALSAAEWVAFLARFSLNGEGFIEAIIGPQVLGSAYNDLDMDSSLSQALLMAAGSSSPSRRGSMSGGSGTSPLKSTAKRLAAITKLLAKSRGLHRRVSTSVTPSETPLEGGLSPMASGGFGNARDEAETRRQLLKLLRKLPSAGADGRMRFGRRLRTLLEDTSITLEELVSSLSQDDASSGAVTGPAASRSPTKGRVTQVASSTGTQVHPLSETAPNTFLDTVSVEVRQFAGGDKVTVAKINAPSAAVPDPHARKKHAIASTSNASAAGAPFSATYSPAGPSDPAPPKRHPLSQPVAPLLAAALKAQSLEERRQAQDQAQHSAFLFDHVLVGAVPVRSPSASPEGPPGKRRTNDGSGGALAETESDSDGDGQHQSGGGDGGGQGSSSRLEEASKLLGGVIDYTHHRVIDQAGHRLSDSSDGEAEDQHQEQHGAPLLSHGGDALSMRSAHERINDGPNDDRRAKHRTRRHLRFVETGVGAAAVDQADTLFRLKHTREDRLRRCTDAQRYGEVIFRGAKGAIADTDVASNTTTNKNRGPVNEKSSLVGASSPTHQQRGTAGSPSTALTKLPLDEPSDISPHGHVGDDDGNGGHACAATAALDPWLRLQLQRGRSFISNREPVNINAWRERHHQMLWAAHKRDVDRRFGALAATSMARIFGDPDSVVSPVNSSLQPNGEQSGLHVKLKPTSSVRARLPPLDQSEMDQSRRIFSQQVAASSQHSHHSKGGESGVQGSESISFMDWESNVAAVGAGETTTTSSPNTVGAAARSPAGSSLSGKVTAERYFREVFGSLLAEVQTISDGDDSPDAANHLQRGPHDLPTSSSRHSLVRFGDSDNHTAAPRETLDEEDDDGSSTPPQSFASLGTHGFPFQSVDTHAGGDMQSPLDLPPSLGGGRGGSGGGSSHGGFPFAPASVPLSVSTTDSISVPVAVAKNAEREHSADSPSESSLLLVTVEQQEEAQRRRKEKALVKEFLTSLFQQCAAIRAEEAGILAASSTSIRPLALDPTTQAVCQTSECASRGVPNKTDVSNVPAAASFSTHSPSRSSPPPQQSRLVPGSLRTLVETHRKNTPNHEFNPHQRMYSTQQLERNGGVPSLSTRLAHLPKLARRTTTKDTKTTAIPGKPPSLTPAYGSASANPTPSSNGKSLLYGKEAVHSAKEAQSQVVHEILRGILDVGAGNSRRHVSPQSHGPQGHKKKLVQQNAFSHVNPDAFVRYVQFVALSQGLNVKTIASDAMGPLRRTPSQQNKQRHQLGGTTLGMGGGEQRRRKSCVRDRNRGTLHPLLSATMHDEHPSARESPRGRSPRSLLSPRAVAAMAVAHAELLSDADSVDEADRLGRSDGFGGVLLPDSSSSDSSDAPIEDYESDHEEELRAAALAAEAEAKKERLMAALIEKHEREERKKNTFNAKQHRDQQKRKLKLQQSPMEVTLSVPGSPATTGTLSPPQQSLAHETTTTTVSDAPVPKTQPHTVTVPPTSQQRTIPNPENALPQTATQQGKRFYEPTRAVPAGRLRAAERQRRERREQQAHAIVELALHVRREGFVL